MADLNNFSEINDNFDTIKTLLNSIRAQGVLNTSDVDRLLEGINSKLEKINTEEDIDLIKVFLTELKQNLEERHNVLISKFGAIESLFSNLLKNSADSLKSSELKELFDVVATNLSVFSREVVSQKETLTDITLRLDAMRSDESQKKDIIKNISVLKSDIDKVNNGFDSIVLSLNENFKTVLNSLSSMNQTDYAEKFESSINDIINSSKTVLSAIQLLDKKNNQIEDSIANLSTQDDIANIKRSLNELSVKSKELSDLVDTVSQKSYKIDNLAEKIDASVNIIAGLKAVISDNDDSIKNDIFVRLDSLEETVKAVNSNEEFEDFKLSIENLLNNIISSSSNITNVLSSADNIINDINSNIKSLDLNVNFENISSDIKNVGEDVKEQVVSQTDKMSQLFEANISRAISDIFSNAERLNTRLKETQTSISNLCEKNFEDVAGNILALKDVVAQLDENNVSANNAIFSNITDRLTLFEDSLKQSLDRQEECVGNSSYNLIEQLKNIKEISQNTDYKIDASVIELTNSKKEFEDLKKSIDSILALDFVNVVKDLRVDLYASKQDLSNFIESSTVDLSEKVTNDLFSKYELLISKLDNVTDEIKVVQNLSLNELKKTLDSISSSIIDVLSYVSQQKNNDNTLFENKLNEIAENVKDSNLNYVENVRDIVDVVRVQVENNLNDINEKTISKLNVINTSFIEQSEEIKNGVASSYNKLLEVQENFDQIKEIINDKNEVISGNFDSILLNSDSIKNDFDIKMSALKTALLNQVNEFKNALSCENADKISEIKFNSENLYTKSLKNATELNDELKAGIESLISNLKEHLLTLNEKLSYSINDIGATNKQIIDYIQQDFVNELTNSVNSLQDVTTGTMSGVEQKVSGFINSFESFEQTVLNNTLESNEKLQSTVTTAVRDLSKEINKSIDALQYTTDKAVSEYDEKINNLSNGFSSLESSIVATSNNAVNDFQNVMDESVKGLSGEIAHSVDMLKASTEDSVSSLDSRVTDVISEFNKLEKTVVDLSEENNAALDSTLSKLIEQFDAVSSLLNNYEEQSNIKLEQHMEVIKADFSIIKNYFEGIDKNIDEDLTRQLTIIERNFESLNNMVSYVMSKGTESIIARVDAQLKDASDVLGNSVDEKLEQYKMHIENLFAKIEAENSNHSDFITNKAAELNQLLDEFINRQNLEIGIKVEEISGRLQALLSENIEASNNDYVVLKDSLTAFMKDIEARNTQLVDSFKLQLDDITKFVDSNIDIQAQEINSKFEDISNSISFISSDVKTSNREFVEEVLNNIKPQIIELDEKMQALFEENSVSFISQLCNTDSKINENLTNSVNEIRLYIDVLKDKLDKAQISHSDLLISQISDINKSFNVLIDGLKSSLVEEMSTVSNSLWKSNKDLFEELDITLEEKINKIIINNTDYQAKELEVIDAISNNIINEIENVKQNSTICKDFITGLLTERTEAINKQIEKNVSEIVDEVLEQLDVFKDAQKDELTNLATSIESSIDGYIIDSVNDLKSHIDIKTDSTILNCKLDNLSKELTASMESVVENLNKLLEISVFSDAINDLKSTNEVLVNSMAEKLNNQVSQFINANVTQKFEEKLNLFDKKFVDSVVEKYEEIKIASMQHNKSLESLSLSINDILSKFTADKDEVVKHLHMGLEGLNKSIDSLTLSFNDLKARILDKTFDTEMQNSLRNQLAGIEGLVKEQLGYIEDITDMCGNNLPDLAEMNTIVKYTIQESLENLSQKISGADSNIGKFLNEFKTDIITQFINLFNQISFVSEQEEIIDFIQEKHSELITILSHIVTNLDDVADVKDNLSVVDNKIDNLKEDIDLINEKITAIISSDSDINYVYSLQDLESDIANFRIALDEMKSNNNSKEFNELLKSTNNIYSLVESIKAEMPELKLNEFRKDFEDLAEDIVSISTRTNKLILSSDESYKTLQDNLQDFKLVINDLDERTRNFAEEAGINKIDDKLACINSMIQNGAKTNKVFNQVFEYLAEWVDRAGSQIAEISDKVETLDDIGQIKVMLQDLKAEAEDTSESAELVETLGNIFDKQAKRITSLEAKLDKIIVETTINKNDNKFDIKPLENTINRFLVAIDEKMAEQQDKIEFLENKLTEAISLMDAKDTAQLTKKVGGMDRQIAKLNKSIEKIASHVVEK